MTESLTVVGLSPETTYYFALRVANEAGNESFVSNSVSETTLAAPVGSWILETVTMVGGFDRGLDYDASDYPAIAYSGDGGGIYLARKSGEAWQIETVDPAAEGPGVDLAFAPDGTPTITYGWGKLKFARKVGGSWVVETVDRDRAKNDYTSLVYDPATGEPTISYSATVKGKGCLKFARKVDGTWRTEVVVQAASRYTSLAYDSDGRSCIAYSDNVDGDNMLDTLMLARWNGSSWGTEIVETGTVGFGVFCCLSFDASGSPAIVHRTGGVRFVKWGGSSWQATVVDTAGTNTSLAHAGNVPYISYTDVGQLKLATHDGTTWQIEVVDPSGTTRTRLRIDPAGKPAICYRPGVKLAHK